jgi:hypothetical protein
MRITPLLLLPHLCHTYVIFNTVFLMDSSSFPAQAFSSLVANLTNATAFALLSTDPDTITGVEGRRLFVNSTGFYSFQLLHVTRVRASVRVGDDQTAVAIIRYSLPHEVALRGMGDMGLDGVEIGADDLQHWFTATYLDLPGFVAQYLILGWAVTVLGFASCVVCYCCCCRKTEVIPPAAIAHVVSGAHKPPKAELVFVNGQHPHKPTDVAGVRIHNAQASSRRLQD